MTNIRGSWKSIITAAAACGILLADFGGAPVGLPMGIALADDDGGGRGRGRGRNDNRGERADDDDRPAIFQRLRKRQPRHRRAPVTVRAPSYEPRMLVTSGLS